MNMATTIQCQQPQPYDKSKQERRMPFSVAQQRRLIGHVTMLMLLLSVAFSSSTVSAAVDDNFKPASWYERYESYPPYCASPMEMQSRKIPPLPNQQTQPPAQPQNSKSNTTEPPSAIPPPLLGETRLVHVTAVLRHGARTPWASAPSLKCWNGFWESPETGVWDCDLTTILAPPNPNRVKEEEGATTTTATSTTTKTADNNAMFLFEKKYDALIPHPAEGGDDSTGTMLLFSNELNGTCQVGQLLLQGYEQELQNGQFLRDAYLYDSTKKFKHDERMRLLDVSFTEYTPWDANHVRFRADDEQRTLMSGQVVLRGMLGPEVIREFEQTGVYPTIPVHTADYDRDYLSPNHQVCPKLNDLTKVAEQSSPYQQFNRSLETRGIREYMSQQLGSSQVEMDCLYTAMCTDRPIPPAIDDYTNDREKKSWFRTITEYQAQQYNLLVMYNDAEYAKLAMAPLWAEIMDNISPILKGNGAEEMSIGTPPPKLALFSGHDTTLMPLLASLGPKVWNAKDWPSYASMMIIEIHEVINDGRNDKTVYKTPFAFRLLYNGKVLTPLIEGCPPNADLCDARHLTERVDHFARRDLDCTASLTSTNEVLRDAATVLSTSTGILMFVGLLISSALLGAFVTFVVLTGRFPRCLKVAGDGKYGQIALSTVGGVGGNDGGATHKGFEDEHSEDF